MAVREIKDGIYSVGVIDWDRQVFDEFMPLPEGTTYSSYLVKGSEKTVLIDAVDAEFEEEFITNLARAGINGIDYIIVNHTEQDHTGSLMVFLELFPNVKIIASEKGADLLEALHQIPRFRVQVVKDGETLSLGNKTLEFMITPWVHWPDTMMTYVREDKVLFSCDLFGAHYACSDLFVEEKCRHTLLAKRYFAEIMMPFRPKVIEYLDRLSGYELSVIAPSHGPCYDDPAYILNLYGEWCTGDLKNKVIIPYISMHGSTKKMVLYLTEALIRRNIAVRPYDVGRADTGQLATDLVDATTIIIATPTVLTGPHPKIANIAFIANILKPRAKFAGVIGSYGWGGKTLKDLANIMDKLEADMFEPVYIKGLPSEEVYESLENLADEILKKHKSENIVL
jgi:flavorubredoxin